MSLHEEVFLHSRHGPRATKYQKLHAMCLFFASQNWLGQPTGTPYKTTLCSSDSKLTKMLNVLP